MKKLILICLAICSMAVISSCGGGKKPSGEIKVGGIDIQQTLTEDFNAMQSLSKEAVFYESEMTLNGDVDTLTSPKVIEMKNIFQLKDTVYLFSHALEGDSVSTFIGKEQGFWCEDCVIEPQTKLSLGQAIEALWKTDCVKPKSSKVTLRKPLGPKILESSYFIFGNQFSGLLFVNTTNGEVADNIFD